MKKIFFIASVLFFVPMFAHAESDHLWISQIQTTGGPGKTTNDFIEIYNPTSQDIDLNGFRLVKRSAAGTTDTSIKSWTDSAVVPAGGYYLWANSSFTDISVTPDVTTASTISDDNGIALRQGGADTGTIIDSVAWGSSTNIFVEGAVFPTNPTVGQALVRTADTDNNSIDFSLADSSPHHSGVIAATNPPPPPPPPPADPPATNPPPPPSSGGGGAPLYTQSVLISEFLPNPDGADSGAEWVELYNNSSTDVDLSGWYLDDEGNASTVGSSAYIFPSGSTIAANKFKVVELPDGVFALDNTGGDTLRLIWPSKQSAQQVAYTDAAPTDTSYARKSDGAYVWTTAVTKGAENQFVAPVVAKADTNPTTTDQTKSDVSSVVNRPIILINELFPEPDRTSDQDEYIELFNPTNSDIDLSGLKIGDLVTSYKLVGTIPANGYFVINKIDSNISLNNSGDETVSLTNAAGEMIANVTYTDAPSQQSYNLLANGQYAWSSVLTPGEENKIETNGVVLAIAKVSKKISSVTANSDANVVSEISTIAAASPTGEIAGANVSQIPASSSQNSFWPWLVASFAANLLFSYILVKFTSRKGNV